MRLGQILLESNLITAQQLAYALEYGSEKSIFLGRALVLIRYMREEDLSKALKAQDLINSKMPSIVVIEALREAVKSNSSLESALQNKNPNFARPEKSPDSAKAGGLAVYNSPGALMDLGETLLLEDRCLEAEVQLKKALELLEQSLGEDDINLAPLLMRLGNTYLALKSFEQGRNCYERVLWLKTKYQPDHELEIARTFESLADLYTAEQDESRAMWAYLSALDLLEKMLPEHLVSYVKVLRKLSSSIESPQAGLNVPVGDILKAAALISDDDLEKALKMSRWSKLPLGVVLRENGMIGDREFQSALKAQFCIKQGVLSELLAVNLLIRACRRDVSLDRLLHEAGTFGSSGEMVDVYQQIATELDELVAAESSELKARPQLASIECKLAKLYEFSGDKTQAEFYYKRAIANWRSDENPNLDLANAYSALAKLLAEQSRQSEGLPLLSAAYEQRSRALGNDDEQTIKTMEDIAETELALGNADKALGLLQKILADRERLDQSGSLHLHALTLSGNCLVKNKDYAAAVVVYNKAIALAKLDGGKPSVALATVVERLADLYKMQKAVTAASALYKQALSIRETMDKPDKKRTEELEIKLSNIQQQM